MTKAWSLLVPHKAMVHTSQYQYFPVRALEMPEVTVTTEFYSTEAKSTVQLFHNIAVKSETDPWTTRTLCHSSIYKLKPVRQPVLIPTRYIRCLYAPWRPKPPQQTDRVNMSLVRFNQKTAPPLDHVQVKIAKKIADFWLSSDTKKMVTLWVCLVRVTNNRTWIGSEKWLAMFGIRQDANSALLGDDRVFDLLLNPVLHPSWPFCFTKKGRDTSPVKLVWKLCRLLYTAGTIRLKRYLLSTYVATKRRSGTRFSNRLRLVNC